MNRFGQNRCREKNFFNVISYKLSFSTIYKLHLSKLTTLILLPALFSCQHDTGNDMAADHIASETKVMLSYPERPWKISSLDIFAFDKDRAGHLDAYQHCEGFIGTEINMRSSNGEKTVFICTEGQRSRMEWSSVNSMEALDRIFVDLRKESRSSLCMSGSADINAGSGIPLKINMRTLASEVTLRSVRCDFTDKAYNDNMISDTRVYLTNVNARCSITAEGDVMPTEIINAGKLDEDYMEIMKEPDMLMHEIPDGIREDISFVNLSMICYPNAGAKDTPGTPFTRLVIEGKIDGETYWWPISINHHEDIAEQGIHRCRQYIYDITITRKGSSDPDEIVDTDALLMKMDIKSWEEKDDYHILF